MRVISYSLYGGVDKYVRGMLANVEAAPQIYPGWIVHIHLPTSDPVGVLFQGYQHVRVWRHPPLPGHGGMFWRFWELSRQEIEYVVVRDADSLVNQREKAAVDRWIASGKPWHVMRDHPDHRNWPILGGMFGAKGGIMPSVGDMIRQWPHTFEKLDDMKFLAQHVWPVMQRDGVMQHSSVPEPLGGEPFPDNTGMGYVGEIRYGDNPATDENQRPHLDAGG